MKENLKRSVENLKFINCNYLFKIKIFLNVPFVLWARELLRIVSWLGYEAAKKIICNRPEAK